MGTYKEIFLYIRLSQCYVVLVLFIVILHKIVLKPEVPLDWIAPLQILCKILDSGIFLCASLAMYIKMTLKDMQDLTFR